VLYEILTGKHAFEGKSQLSIMTAILEREPERIAMIPAGLEHVGPTCLAKEPAERWQRAYEVARGLRWVAGAGMDKGTVGIATKIGGLRWWGISIAAVLVAIALTLAGAYYAIRPTRPIWTVAVVPPSAVIPATIGRNGPPQISPDGSRVAFVGCPTAQ